MIMQVYSKQKYIYCKYIASVFISDSMLYAIFQINQNNMKLKNIIFAILATIVLTSCYTSKRISKFSSENIDLGIDKNLFIKRYGKPFNKEISYTQDNQEKEKLFYKEELYKETWAEFNLQMQQNSD